MNRLSSIFLVGLLLTSGCAVVPDQQALSYTTLPAPVAVVEVTENPVPGTVTEPWVEPMFDQVDVPGQIDPAGNYYRLPHRTTWEIRTDRVEGVQYEGRK